MTVTITVVLIHCYLCVSSGKSTSADETGHLSVDHQQLYIHKCTKISVVSSN